MTRPKGKLFALLAIFVAIGLITASGAFTSVSAERTATVTVAGDQDAILGLTPHSGVNGNNSGAFGSSNGYADLQNGELIINLGGFTSGTPDGQGVNFNASTKFDYVFNVTNNGQSSVDYSIEATGNHPSTVVFYQGTVDGATNVTTSANAQTLASGSTAQISIEVDTLGLGQGDLTSPLIDSVFINATAN